MSDNLNNQKNSRWKITLYDEKVWKSILGNRAWFFANLELQNVS